MANDCWFMIQAVADNPEVLRRLGDILDYKDEDFYIYRVREVDIREPYKLGDLWVCEYSGSVAWSASNWFYDVPEQGSTDHEGDEPTQMYMTLPILAQILGFAYEVWTEECGEGFREHAARGIDGKGEFYNSASWSEVYPKDENGDEDYDAEPIADYGGFGDHSFDWAAPLGIYNGEVTNWEGCEDERFERWG